MRRLIRNIVNKYQKMRKFTSIYIGKLFIYIRKCGWNRVVRICKVTELIRIHSIRDGRICKEIVNISRMQSKMTSWSVRIFRIDFRFIVYIVITRNIIRNMTNSIWKREIMNVTYDYLFQN